MVDAMAQPNDVFAGRSPCIDVGEDGAMGPVPIRAREATADARSGRACPSLPIWLGLFASLLLTVGGIWDISWHRTLGRDTFWSPPHLFIYGGIAVLGLDCVAVVAGATVARRRRPPEGATLVKLWGLQAPLGFTIAGFGVLSSLLSAPFDEWWHRTFGLDVTVWSPPHLLAIAAAAAIRLGLIVALVEDMQGAGQPNLGGRLQASWRRTTVAEWVLLLLLSFLLGNLTFALGEYDYLAASRDPLVYPVLASLAVPVVLVAGVQTVGRVGAATVIVVLLVLRRALMSAVLMATDFVPPAPAPLYLVPAMALDGWFWLRRDKPGGPWRCVMAGATFGGLFVAAEYAFTGHLTGRFWPLQPLALSAPLAAAVGGLSAWAGARLAQWWLRRGRAAVR
jgi:hypothetical protein